MKKIKHININLLEMGSLVMVGFIVNILSTESRYNYSVQNNSCDGISHIV